MSVNEILRNPPQPWSDVYVNSLHATGAVVHQEYYSNLLMAAAQSLTSSAAAVLANFTTVSSSSGFAAPIAGVLTIPATGLYAMSGSVNIANGTGDRRLEFLVNAAASNTATLAAPAAGEFSVTISGIQRLTAGDTVSLLAYQNSGGALDATTTIPCRFSLYRLAP